jgi:CheY-like chemotaxis protein
MSKHIVLCDDEVAIIRAAEIKLSRAGYQVTCCRDGREGLDVFERESPDLLLTDCQMPRMNGIELIRALRERPETRELPVIMLTAKGFELPLDDVMRRLNVLKVVSKPFSPRELLQLVNGLFVTETV